MPSPTLPLNSVRCVVYYRTPNRTCTTDLYYEVDATTPITDQATIEAVADKLYTDWVAQYTAVMSNVFTFKGVMAYYKGAGDVLWEGGKFADAPGEYEAPISGDEQALPDEVACVVRKLTGRAGREDRGRVFLSTVCEDQNDAGTMTLPARTAYNAFAAQIPATIVVPATVGPPATPSVTLNARHWNRKDNTLRPITAARAVATFCSRRDRRKPLVLIPTA